MCFTVQEEQLRAGESRFILMARTRVSKIVQEFISWRYGSSRKFIYELQKVAKATRGNRLELLSSK